MGFSITFSGYIKPNKITELEQTFKQAIAITPNWCNDVVLCADIIDKNKYYFKASFLKINDLHSFLKTESYQLIFGSFKVLGFITDIKITEFHSLQTK